jgi:hypothetical protein
MTKTVPSTPPVRVPHANKFIYEAHKHGIAIRGCGIAAMRLVIIMADHPVSSVKIPVQQGHRHHEIQIPEGNNSLGILVREGLAAFHRDEQHYRLTERGQQWLDALKKHGLTKLA